MDWISRATYNGMINRCYNKKHPSYHNYGGRGITVCQKWLDSFVDFKKDMGPRPAVTYSLDRKDNDKNYTPENCRWANPETQVRNSRQTKMTLEQVKSLLFSVHDLGVPFDEAYKEFPVTKGQARNIVLGKSYRLEGYEYPTKLPPKINDCRRREFRRLLS